MDKFSIHVKGKNKNWSFTFIGEEEHLQDWIADGLEVYRVDEEIEVAEEEYKMIKRMVRAKDIYGRFVN